MMMGVTNVITSIFVENTILDADKRHIQEIEKAAGERDSLKSQVLELFENEIDSDHDGFISEEDLLASYEHPTVQAFFAHLDHDSVELDTLFRLLKSGGAHVKISHFVEGCFRMGRAAKSIDVMLLMEAQNDISKRLVAMRQ